MKVGIISSLYNYGGVQSCVISLTRGLNANKIKPTLLSDQPLNISIVEENKVLLEYAAVRFNIRRAVANRISPILGGAVDLVYYLRTSWIEEHFDFLYIFHPNIIVDDGRPHLYYLSMSPKSLGFSGNRLRSNLKFWLYDWLLKKRIPVYEFGSLGRNCVINSQYTENLFFGSYNRHLNVVYPPSHFVRQQCTIQQDRGARRLIVYFSRLSKAKRPSLILDLAKRFPEEQFVIMGGSDDSGYEQEIVRAASNGEHANVNVMVDVSPEIASSILSESKFYVFPAVNEHFGITTVEAMSRGVIPFVHDSGGQREIVPWELLRFSDSNMTERFEALLRLNSDETEKITNSFPEHLKQFGEDCFIEKMLKPLRELEGQSAQ